MSPTEWASLADVVRRHAETRPDHRAFTFLANGEVEADHLSFADLDRDARACAARLQALVRRGDRALLLFPPGLDFVRAFFGCLYAGVVAVPAYPPRRNRTADRLRAITADAAAVIALTEQSVAAALTRAEETGLRLPVLVVGRATDADAAAWHETTNAPSDIAFLQYTSGSTGTPRGVQVTHGNLIHNSESIRVGFGHGPHTVFVSWLPAFHDMGLIGTVLQPAYLGIPGVLMEPAAFLQKPLRWLQAISTYRGTTSGAPNSAYELCLRKISDAERASLDLSSWESAFNGSEPVRESTIRRFADAFGPAGFRRTAMRPCYGMAETTLLVSIPQLGAAPVVCHDTGTPVVSCGRTSLDTRVRIVDPEHGTTCADGVTGEIWVAGGSVASGYWNRPEETAATFGTVTAEGDGPYLRTGDLGFVREGALYVAGRLKDLIICRGRNLYPQDIEQSAGQAHAALNPDACAAFSVPAAESADDTEQLVVVCEVAREHLARLDADAVIRAVRARVTDDHEVDPAAIVLLRTLGLPKTSSGKTQRRLCRTQWLEGALPVVGEWRRPATTPPAGSAPDHPTVAAVRGWLVARLAAESGLPLHAIDTRAPFSQYGLDSARAVALSGNLQAWLGAPLSPTLAYDFPTIEAIARHLAGDGPGEASSVTEAAPEPIAVVGLGCRFPGAPSPEAFWALLASGRSAIGDAPPQRPHAAELGRAGFLDQVETFDARYFGISPREAEAMDPQQRLLLEVARESLAHAGLEPERLTGSRTGVFIGISNLDYLRLQSGQPAATDPYAGTGTALSIAANRISFHFDLRGPSWAVDTACSSSLVAVHQACDSLRRGECSAALAGGVNLILSPQVTQVFTRAGMLSPRGVCRTFDAEADGYVRGEGAAVVVLMRASDAARQGLRILGLIRGSAVNQDGRTNGLTAPNGPAQEAVVRAALQAAQVAPADISYVESHGTGTPLGDPIEVQALSHVLAEGRTMGAPCQVGALKTNVGHLEAAAGIAGLVKVLLALTHEVVPPNLHFTRLNPHINLDNGVLALPATARPWPRGETPRRAGISAFGFGGTNCHVIVEEAPAAIRSDARVMPMPVFARERYWISEEAASSTAPVAPAIPAHPVLGDHLPGLACAPRSQTWDTQLAPDVAGNGATAVLELALAAAATLAPGRRHHVSDLEVRAGAWPSGTTPVHVQTVVDSTPDGRHRLQVYRAGEAGWLLAATATLREVAPS